MRWFHGLVMTSCLIGCAESNPPCEANGESFQADEGAFCLYGKDSPLVIEGGFDCPAQFAFRFDTEAGIACSEQEFEELPMDVCAHLGAECEDGDKPALPYEAKLEPMSPPNEKPAEDDPWRQVAEDRGFIKPLEDSDFFEAMQYGCIVDTVFPRPATWQALVEESNRVVLASIRDVVVDPELPSEEGLTEDVFLRLNVEDTGKGESEDTLLVSDTCGTGGKVWPLRQLKPEDSYVFFLVDSDPVPATGETTSFLNYYYLGIVREDEGVLSFALGDGVEPPSLEELDSLPALIDAVRGLQE